jgi:hypothetical protein
MIRKRIRSRSKSKIRIGGGLGVLLPGVVVAQVEQAQEGRAPIRRLDDGTRAKVLSAMAGLIILGFAVVLLTWLAARVVQRYRNGTSYFRPTVRPGEHEWSKKPLPPGEA